MKKILDFDIKERKNDTHHTRKKSLYIEVTEEEYKEVMKQKKFLNLSSYSDLIRMYIHTGVSYRFDYSAFSDVATELSRIGNNINQIARAVNESRSITKYQVQMLQKNHEKIQETFADMMQQKAKVTRRLAEEYFRGGMNGNNQDHKDKNQPKEVD